jgi:hypothetical protein
LGRIFPTRNHFGIIITAQSWQWAGFYLKRDLYSDISVASAYDRAARQPEIMISALALSDTMSASPVMM